MLNPLARGSSRALFLLLAGTNQVSAQDLWTDTYLLDVYVGSYRSGIAKELSKGGYELSGGKYVDFRDWYTPRFPDATILFLRQLSPDFGLVWGFSTGESGEKYRIDPAFQMGFVYQYEPFKNSVLAVKATYPLFGDLAEGQCTADYGDIGGIQPVNCRLAADIISPEETLDYLVNVKGKTDARISISFTYVF